MLQRAFGLFVAFSFVGSFSTPLCAAAPAPAHSCCAGRSRKSNAAPRCTCCRLALPSSARPAADLPATALTPSLAIVRALAAASPLVAGERRFVRGAAPPGPTDLSPPARAA
ncbi:MAG TPA: hypothetical protein VH309_03645 [Elusimicrobiota bacterium]|jgi:hypothetical protein|nr:hypothetical protein [Elusimicrobiota bacterium]